MIISGIIFSGIDPCNGSILNTLPSKRIKLFLRYKQSSLYVSSLFKKGLKLYYTRDEKHFIKKTYSECQGISIDYGILEKAKNVYVLTADFGWSDLGTWSSLYESKEKDMEGNVISGDNILIYDSKNCIMDISDEKVAIVHGLDGYIIAESNDTLMICKKEDEDQIKKFVTDVRINKGDSLV